MVVLSVIVLAAFTAYVVLDTFVIKRVYSTVSSGETVSSSKTSSASSTSTTSATSTTSSSKSSTSALSVISTENTYSDDNITITVTEYREYDTSIYVADVIVSSPEYLKTALAENSYGKNITENTSVIAKENSAILAINGDFYGAQTKGYVIRNGVLYRDTSAGDQEDLVIYKDGSFGIINEQSVSAKTLINNGAEQVLCFGPALVENSTVAVNSSEEVGKAMASNPRTAIGIIDSCHYLFVVSDGRTTASEGLSLYQLACFMQSLGTVTAYNLDGGGSSTMYFNGKVINNPTTSGSTIKERSVSDIVYIG